MNPLLTPKYAAAWLRRTVFTISLMLVAIISSWQGWRSSAALQTTPTLGSYSNMSVNAGNNATVSPSAAPSATTRTTAVTTASFKGLLTVDPATGAVQVTNAQPAGAYTVTVRAFGSGGTATRTFTLTVSNPPVCVTGGGNFASSSDPAAPAGPRDIATGDFNRDGKLDFITANAGGNNVSIFSGDGAGGFVRTDAGVGIFPLSVTTGDFNGDGNLDFATANNGPTFNGSPSVSLGLGNGGGAFTVSSFNISNFPEKLAAVDVNNDGLLDLAIGRVGVYLGNGQGGFTQASNIPAAAVPSNFAAGDFNGDGRLDFVGGTSVDAAVTLRLQDAAGGFSSTPQTITVGQGVRAVVAADFNQDGRLDFATANYDAGTLSLCLQNTSGGFAATTLTVSTGPIFLAAGDVNGDGKLDLLSANFGTFAVPGSTVSLRLANANNGYDTLADISAGTGARALALGDFNGDGKLDFVTANASANTVSLRLNSCNTAPQITPTTITRTKGAGPSRSVIAYVSDRETPADQLTVTLADVPPGLGVTNLTNEAGAISADVEAGCAAAGSAYNFTLIARESGGLTSAPAYPTVNVVPGVLSIDTPPANQRVAIGQTATFSVAATNATGYQWKKNGASIAGANANSYTTPPVALSDNGALYSVTVYGCVTTQNATATLNVIPPPTLGTYPNVSVVAGGSRTVAANATPTDTTSTTAYASPSFTGLLSANPATGVVSVTQAQPLGMHTITVKAVGPSGSVTKTFTLTVTNPADCGTSSFAAPVAYPASANTWKAVPGDFNGDGITDLAIAMYDADYDEDFFAIRMGDGNGGFSAEGQGYYAYDYIQDMAAGDFNGDGKQDIVVLDRNYNTVDSAVLWLSDGAGGFTHQWLWNVSGFLNEVRVGDFNGDGQLDLAYLEEQLYGAGICFRLRLGDGAGGFSNPVQTISFSASDNIRALTAGDFNGDGKLDFSVANASLNTVVLYCQNTDGSFTAKPALNTGAQPNDIATGDFNGDGKLDFAVTNSGESTVTLGLSQANGTFLTATVAVGASPAEIVTGYFNGDGYLDFAVNYFGNNTPNNDVSLRLGKGDGTFTSAPTLSFSAAPFPLVLNDLNNDGKFDVVTLNYYGQQVLVQFNNCNAAPAITAGAALTRTQGTAALNAEIATVSDSDTPLTSLRVTGPTGKAVTITVTNIAVNPANGKVTADVSATCLAPAGPQTIALSVSDGSTLSTASLTINVLANTPPVLGYNATYSADSGTALTINPSPAPTDNGTVASVAVQGRGTYTGGITVNAAGVVSLTNAAPVGVHTITIRATDNCGATRDASFTLNVTTPLPQIITQPVSRTVAAGSTVSFSVAATGTITQYWWTKDGDGLNGIINPSAYTPTLTLTNVSPLYTGTYQLRIYYDEYLHSVLSQEVTLTVLSAPAPLMIAEFRLSGPGQRGVAGSSANDWYVKLYNATDAPLSTTGLKLMFTDAAGQLSESFDLTPGKFIPVRGSYLVAGSGYSLNNVAAPDQVAGFTMLTSLGGVGVFRDGLALNQRLDSVGLASLTGTFAYFIEGTALPAVGAPANDYCFVRQMTLPSGMTDTNNNASDFVLVELNGATLNGNTTTQGAPGPSGLLSPTGVTASAIATALLDPAAATTAAPNQARLNPNPNVSTSIAELGTLALRRTYTNNTTQPIRKLCFRVIDITNSATGTLARVNVLDANGGVMATSAGNKTVYGTRLLAPSVTQGGLNAALGVNEITLASPLPPGQAVNVEFLLGVRRGGTYRFVVRFEVQTQ